VYDAGTAPDSTWRITGEEKISSHRISGVESVRQAVMLILSTERCRYPIFSWDYGVELEDLTGRPVSFVKPELERRVREALSRDDRITGADGFVFEHKKKSLHCTFTVRTIFGEFTEGIRLDNI
jgi:hypothetical protein